MHHTSRFLASAALYAVDLSSLSRRDLGTSTPSGAPLYRYDIQAIWFKRRRGLDTANAGYLWDITTDRYEEGDAAEAQRFLETTLTDGRYGGTCRSRWDGERLWSDPALAYEGQQADAAFLRAMLDAFPEIPSGFDGWWSFKP